MTGLPAEASAGWHVKFKRNLNQFEHVYAVGISKSHHPALLLEQLLIKANKPFRAIEIGLLNEICDAMSERDLIMVFSLSQRHSSFHSLEGTAGTIFLVTATPTGPLSKIADRQIVFPSVTLNPEESALSPIVFDMFVELLTQYLTATPHPSEKE